MNSISFSAGTMSKSGEILRLGHGNYSFLCIHCGFNFHDINEILVHIDYHFDMLDSKVIDPEGTSHFQNCSNLSEDVMGYPSQTMPSVEGILNPNNIRTEFKIEDSRDTKSYLDELPLDVKIEHTKTTPLSPRIRCNKTRTITKRKAEVESKTLDATRVNSCAMSFENSVDCQSEVAHQTLNKVFQCYICGNFCKNFALLKRHLRAGLHSKTTCYQCESLPTIRNEHDPRPHKCFLCRSWFENHLLFRKHFKDVHKEDVDKFFRKRSNCNEYTCYVCKKDFLHKYYLRNHLIVHNEIKAFVCDVCGKTYRTKAILKRHLNVHEGKTYTCEDCGKTFPYYARLRIHRYSHRTELNYKCTVCSKAFKVQKYLARHMKMHQDEKAYACKYCSKR